MTAQHDILAAAQRAHLYIFVMKVFEQLHPGGRQMVPEWYLEAICYRLEKLEAAGYGRLVISLAPRHLKSIITSVAFAAWILGRNPGRRVMVACYSHDLSRQHAEHCRVIMESDWYRRLFPRTRISERGNRQLELVTTAGGGRKGVSVGGSVTGFGADLIIIDDCMKAEDVNSQAARETVKSWFDNTLLTRLNDRDDSAILSIQQRLHEDDLTAYLLEKGYEHLNLPSIAQKSETIALSNSRVHVRLPGDLLSPVRRNHKVLEVLRREMGPAGFSAQFLQDPVAPEGNTLRMEWFGTYTKKLERRAFQKVLQSWDTAVSDNPKANFSVCTTWGFRNRKWFLLDVYRQRVRYTLLRNAVIRLQREWKADRVLIEKTMTADALWDDLVNRNAFRPILIPVTTDKEKRLEVTIGEIENGHILLPAEAPWLDAFRKELKAFPHGSYDDQVDSMTQFLAYQHREWGWLMEDGSLASMRKWAHEPERPW